MTLSPFSPQISLPAFGLRAGCESDAHACMWPTAVGLFACQKLCVCPDFVGEPAGGFKKPTACP